MLIRSSAANGAPPLPVAIDGNTTVTFAVATRQLFSLVTGAYTDFAGNGTTDIRTDVVCLPRYCFVSFTATLSLPFSVHPSHFASSSPLIPIALL